MKKLFMLLMMGLTVSSVYAQEVVSEEGAAQPSTFNSASPLGSAGNFQSFKFAYLSYQEALKSMPQYAITQKGLDNLKAQYQAETQRVEEEFNRKYEEFLDGQREFPKTILQKRQTELQELMTKNIEFKENSRKELAKAEQEAMAPLRLRLSDLLREIGMKYGYAFILDTDIKALPFINPEMGENINQLVQDALQ